nr:MAG TPA: hypothetical protein [Caudoviricetes sp.]
MKKYILSFFIFYLLNSASFMGAFFIKKPPAELVA